VHACSVAVGPVILPANRAKAISKPIFNRIANFDDIGKARISRGTMENGYEMETHGLDHFGGRCGGSGAGGIQQPLNSFSVRLTLR
jgi:hypothetical protein